jgi:hypothetical protein
MERPRAEGSEGLSLRDAVERFSPEKWETYAAAAAAAGRTRTRYFFVGDEPIAGRDAYRQAVAGNRLVDAREQAERALYDDFLSRLQSGELIASGYRVPIDPAIGRQVIPADLWTVLRPNVPNSSARGGGCQFVSVLVSRRPVSIPFAELPLSRDATERRAPSFPGRPSVMRAIEQEMRRRAGRGELQDKLSEECKHLEEWAENEFEGQQTPKWRSIANAVRNLYKQLKAQKTGMK